MSVIESIKNRAAITLQNAHKDVQDYVAALEAQARSHLGFTALIGTFGIFVGALIGHVLW